MQWLKTCEIWMLSEWDVSYTASQTKHFVHMHQPIKPSISYTANQNKHFVHSQSKQAHLSKNTSNEFHPSEIFLFVQQTSLETSFAGNGKRKWHNSTPRWTFTHFLSCVRWTHPLVRCNSTMCTAPAVLGSAIGSAPAQCSSEEGGHTLLTTVY